jgi:ATP-dependent Lon protease
LAMTGSLSVRGEVLPVGGVTAKTQAAIKAQFKEIIVPASNLEDIVLMPEERQKIKIIPVNTLEELLDHAFVKGRKKSKLLLSLKKLLRLGEQSKKLLKKAASKQMR